MKIPVFISLLLVTLALAAQQDALPTRFPTHFIVFTADGGRIDCALANRPKVVIGDGQITVVNDDVTLEYPVDMVHKYRLGKPDDDAIETLKAGATGNVEWGIGTILLSGFGHNETVQLIDVNGLIHKQAQTDAHGCLALQTSGLSAGCVYIVRVGKQSFKFIKR